MVGSQPTLLDILSSHQFQVAILFSLGLEDANIVYFLDMTEASLIATRKDILVRAECLNADHLKARLLFESENELLEPVRLQVELTELQRRASEILADQPALLPTPVEFC